MKLSNCEFCNKEFSYDQRIQAGKYCSKDCRYADHSSIIKKSYTPELRKKKSLIATEKWKKWREEHPKPPKISKKKGRPITAVMQAICKECHIEFSYTINDRSGIFCSHKCYLKFVRENASNYRIKAFSLLPNECFYCGEKNKSILEVHHKDRNTLNNDIDNLQIACSKCHSKLHLGEGTRENKFKDGQILRALRNILDGLRLDVNSPNFKETPERVLRSYYEIFKGEGKSSTEEILQLFSSAFPSNYTGIIAINKIEVFSMCPHHLLPVEYLVDVGYISKEGQMLGISKLPRLVELLAARLVLQETLTDDIVKSLMEYLKADGAMAIVTGKHMCMRMRGVHKPDADTITSSVSGVFERDLGARQEFLQLINRSTFIRM